MLTVYLFQHPSNPKAPKVIHSNNIKEFRLRFTYEGGITAASDEDALPSFPSCSIAVMATIYAWTVIRICRQNARRPLMPCIML